MDQNPTQLAVIGAAACGRDTRQLAFEVGAEIARQGAITLCGGRGGVMEQVAAGAKASGGLTVGILPGRNAEESPPNPYIDLAIYTGMGQARNQILVLSAAAVIAVAGGWGTLSEIGLALKHGIPVVGLESWRLSRPDGRDEPLLRSAASASQAVELALKSARSSP